MLFDGLLNGLVTQTFYAAIAFTCIRNLGTLCSLKLEEDRRGAGILHRGTTKGRCLHSAAETTAGMSVGARPWAAAYLGAL